MEAVVAHKELDIPGVENPAKASAGLMMPGM